MFASATKVVFVLLLVYAIDLRFHVHVSAMFVGLKLCRMRHRCLQSTFCFRMLFICDHMVYISVIVCVE